jgi:hypothetical protein
MTEQVPIGPTAPTPNGTPPAVNPVDQAIFNEEISTDREEQRGGDRRHEGH